MKFTIITGGKDAPATVRTREMAAPGNGSEAPAGETALPPVLDNGAPAVAGEGPAPSKAEARAQLERLLAPPAPPVEYQPPERPVLRLGPGVYVDIAHVDYLNDPGERPTLSSSIAQVIAETNAFKAWHRHPRLGAPKETAGTAATKKGSVLHKLVLGKGQDIEVVDAADFKTKLARELRDAAIAAGRIPIVTDKFAGLQVLAEQLRARMLEKGVTLAGETELTAIWERDGVLCRCRFDHFDGAEAVIDDPKFTTSASPEDFTRKMVEYGYDIQWAAYTEAIETLYPDLVGRVRMRFVVSEANEDDPSNEVSVIEPDGTMRELGRKRWRRAKEIWRRCLAGGVEVEHWPGYTAAPVKVSAPAWALQREMETQTNRMENDAKPEF